MFYDVLTFGLTLVLLVSRCGIHESKPNPIKPKKNKLKPTGGPLPPVGFNLVQSKLSTTLAVAVHVAKC